MHAAENLTFNFGTAETVAGKFRSAAQSVSYQQSGRQSIVSTGSQDFKCRFADGLTYKAETASADGT